ncbi:hypothetical protein DTO013E5_2902 [Penicillium roqueforti]|nr:hypothetical protein CBS147337_7637 [Penicillium roqueforti]KAI2684488.1 hypothetical protein LCP963914a_5220 [Penicillium roqueforti]KAI2701038.1 hypothetical protein CBS147372_5108 [Penicillium roqueforti]KAI2727362.1 hypothetical protein CBS147354_3564 [Penicillium roqueforti]KAI2739040.1 hypothetical protein DTO012A1_6305 [Penicillium roqueforti]
MSNDQVSTYLKDLRANRPARPTGSRPYPGKAAAVSDQSDNLPPRASSAFSMRTPVEHDVEDRRSGSAMSHRRANSQASAGAMGRPLAQEPRTHSIRKNVFPAQIHARTISIPASPALSYRENGQRRHEKEEARALREALQKMDIEDDVGLHQAAQDEATQLVWMHQNPGQAFKNPYAPYQNPDANKGSQSPVKNGSREYDPLTNKFSQSTGSSISSDGNSSPESLRKRSSLAGPSKKNLKVNFKLPELEESVAPEPQTVSSDSFKGILKNPKEQIYEEPIETKKKPEPKKEPEPKSEFSKSDSSAMKNKPRNALGRIPRPLPWLQNRVHSSPMMDKISRFETPKDTPTKPRNAGYTRNESATPSPTQSQVAGYTRNESPTPSPTESHKAGYARNERATPTPPPEEKDELVSIQDGRERRSDEIRAATSKKRGDRSEKLPMPSAVSDRVGRPIVSFDKTWKPVDQPKPDRPTLPVIEIAPPTIEVSEPTPVPVINIPDIKVPTISEIEASSKQAARPHPTGKKPQSQSRWYSPYTRTGVPTASCERCTLSISGKIVTAGGCRFHPECFTCFHCSTPLECVAFYSEPESNRAERLSKTDSSDIEARVPRFYCHLDFHEMFSPRCKSCKTPIEGEVVVACGAEWHVGHFFCAECGDPFDSQTPFVEKDGFAWCLNCHSRRTAPRCLGCKKQVMDDVVVSAIGGQWHESCFNCHECGEGFGSEGRFFVREGEPKRTAKGRIIGGPVQLAICERCEGIRLKAPGMC